MTICLRCHRPLKNPAINGMGPVCAKAAKPVPEVERDLFGYDVQAAFLAVQAGQDLFVDAKTAQVQRELDAEYVIDIARLANLRRWEAYHQRDAAREKQMEPA